MTRHILSHILLCFSVFTFGQITISGTVTDNVGVPLFGAEIIVKDSVQYRTTTDYDGHFSIKVPNLNITLVASYVGFVSQEVGFQNSPENAVLGISNVEIMLSEGLGWDNGYFGIGPLCDFKNESLGINTDISILRAFGIRPKINLKFNSTFNTNARLVDLKLSRFDLYWNSGLSLGLFYKYRSFILPKSSFDKRQNIYGAASFYSGHYLFIGYATEKFQNSPDRFDRGVQHGINLEFQMPVQIGSTYFFQFNFDYSKFNKEEYYSINIARYVGPFDIGLIWRDVSLYKSMELSIRYGFAF